ncbi:MAG: hypothetical protein QOF23_428 [Solirubrobacterales bacterium]|nr:hypothetical protein [Solirubrobacterales bacterium]
MDVPTASPLGVVAAYRLAWPTVTWNEVFAVLVVSHLVGDFLFQTDWQARHKYGGLGPDPLSRRALRNHIATYMLAFLPALVWIGIELDLARAVLIAFVVAVPHWIQDDGRLLDAYMARVKGLAQTSAGLRVAVDQSFHAVFLLGAALLAVA